LGRCLTEGFAYQGENSAYRHGERRGSPTVGLPPAAFISFLQNHDQVGNRAFGERIIQLADARSVRAAQEILLLAPFPPLLFMGEEFGADTPFLFFCDFEKDLAAAVTEGRRNEFAQFSQFSNPQDRVRIPDPNAPGTFKASRLQWDSIEQPRHQEWLRLYRNLLKLRRKYILPLVSSGCVSYSRYELTAEALLTTHWTFSSGQELVLHANFGKSPVTNVPFPASQKIFASEGVASEALQKQTLPAWSVIWFLKS
jgi:1,4-alpha-glucan branching enzyme